MVLTLNLLCPEKLNPLLLAEAFLNRTLNFIQTPMAPPGTKVLIFEGPGDWSTFSHNGAKVWYLVPAPYH